MFAPLVAILGKICDLISGLWFPAIIFADAIVTRSILMNLFWHVKKLIQNDQKGKQKRNAGKRIV